MGKHYKKPPVRAEVVRKWLERCEVDGESPPQIAKADGYDVRTVRKQLELMRREREVREARQQVLRQALERHYGDLCAFAEKLKADMSGNVPTDIAWSLKEDPMWQALREHLPRISLWRNIERWLKSIPEFEEAVEKLKERINAEAVSGSSLKFSSSLTQTGLYDGFTNGMLFHLQAVARGWQGLNGIEPRPVETEHGVRVERGAFTLALAPEGKVNTVDKLFDAMMDEALDWEEYSRLKRSTDEFLRVKREIHKELTAIILRRVLPGKCLYCPI